jgi:hypothetical protein
MNRLYVSLWQISSQIQRIFAVIYCCLICFITLPWVWLIGLKVRVLCDLVTVMVRVCTVDTAMNLSRTLSMLRAAILFQQPLVVLPLLLPLLPLLLLVLVRITTIVVMLQIVMISAICLFLLILYPVTLHATLLLLLLVFIPPVHLQIHEI